jgi:hypothetical protein
VKVGTDFTKKSCKDKDPRDAQIASDRIMLWRIRPNRSGPSVWIYSSTSSLIFEPTDPNAWNPCVRVGFLLHGLASDRGGWFHDLPVEVPTRMCQDRHRDREPN